MKKKLTLLAFALSAAAAAMTLAPAPAKAVKCWTTCCQDRPSQCITCCVGQGCPDIMCP
jgi:hypothetical protein